MRKTSLTEANSITADLVLQLSKMYSAKDLRGLQTKFTKTSHELRGLTSGNTLLGRSSQDPHEIEPLRRWAQVLSSAELHEETP